MMDGIWQWGLVVITTLQSAQGPALEAVSRAVSFLGDEHFAPRPAVVGAG